MAIEGIPGSQCGLKLAQRGRASKPAVTSSFEGSWTGKYFDLKDNSILFIYCILYIY